MEKMRIDSDTLWSWYTRISLLATLYLSILVFFSYPRNETNASFHLNYSEGIYFSGYKLALFRQKYVESYKFILTFSMQKPWRIICLLNSFYLCIYYVHCLVLKVAFLSTVPLTVFSNSRNNEIRSTHIARDRNYHNDWSDNDLAANLNKQIFPNSLYISNEAWRKTMYYMIQSLFVMMGICDNMKLITSMKVYLSKQNVSHEAFDQISKFIYTDDTNDKLEHDFLKKSNRPSYCDTDNEQFIHYYEELVLYFIVFISLTYIKYTTHIFHGRLESISDFSVSHIKRIRSLFFLSVILLLILITILLHVQIFNSISRALFDGKTMAEILYQNYKLLKDYNYHSYSRGQARTLITSSNGDMSDQQETLNFQFQESFLALLENFRKAHSNGQVGAIFNSINIEKIVTSSYHSIQRSFDEYGKYNYYFLLMTNCMILSTEIIQLIPRFIQLKLITRCYLIEYPLFVKATKKYLKKFCLDINQRINKTLNQHYQKKIDGGYLGKNIVDTRKVNEPFNLDSTDDGEYSEEEFDDQIEKLRLCELLCIILKSVLSIVYNIHIWIFKGLTNFSLIDGFLIISTRASYLKIDQVYSEYRSRYCIKIEESGCKYIMQSIPDATKQENENTILNKTECAICLTLMKKNTKKLPRCGHYFHTKCLQRYITVSISNNEYRDDSRIISSNFLNAQIFDSGMMEGDSNQSNVAPRDIDPIPSSNIQNGQLSENLGRSNDSIHRSQDTDVPSPEREELMHNSAIPWKIVCPICRTSFIEGKRPTDEEDSN